MTTNSRKTEPRAARPADLRPAPRAVLHAPPAWVFGVVALLLMPWLVVAWIYLGRDPAPEPRPNNGTGPSVKAAAGPWGQLEKSPIVISPPLEYVSPNGGRGRLPDWHFPGTSPELFRVFLGSAGLSSEDIGRLERTARTDPRTGSLVVTPDPGWIRTIPSDVRGRIYTELARTPLNFDQEQAFRFFGQSADAWLAGSSISPATRALVEPMIYREGSFLYFADIEVVRPLVGSQEEVQRLAKTLLRHSTVLVRLTVSSDEDVDELAEYWGRGGRRTDVRPLLESVAASDRSIDIVHLLPTFARNHLYRYPKLTTADFDRPIIANCLWTALNFFRGVPDDRFLDPHVAMDALRTDYYVVEHGFQLGDIVAFLDEDGDLFHVAVYIADNLAFSKNGTSPMAPWTFMSIDHIKEYYRERTKQPRLIYHRRNDQ